MPGPGSEPEEEGEGAAETAWLVPDGPPGAPAGPGGPPGRRRREVKRAAAAWAAAVAVLAGLAAAGAGRPRQVDTGIGGFRARNSALERRYDAVMAGMAALDAGGGAGRKHPKREQRQTHRAYWLTTVYETKPPGGNLLDPQCLEEIFRLEEDMLKMQGYSAYCTRERRSAAAGKAGAAAAAPGGVDPWDPDAPCKRPLSLLTVVERLVEQGLAQDTGATVDALKAAGAPAELVAMVESISLAQRAGRWTGKDLTLAQKAKMVAQIAPLVPSNALERTVGGADHPVGWLFDSKFVAAGAGKHRQLSALRTAFSFGFPLEGYASYWDRTREQRADYYAFVKSYTPYFERLETEHVAVMHAGQGITQDEVERIIYQDVAKAGLAFALVALCLLLHTRNPWLVANGMFGIVASLPITYLLCHDLLGFRQVNFLDAVLPFVLVGVGCDDIILLHDTVAWRKPGASIRSATLVAARAMLATSVTTSIAFLTNYISYIPPVRMMGLFAAVCVMVNYAIAVTLLPAALHLQGCLARSGIARCGARRAAERAYQPLDPEIELSELPAAPTDNDEDVTPPTAGPPEGSAPPAASGPAQPLSRRVLAKVGKGITDQHGAILGATVGLLLFFALVLAGVGPFPGLKSDGESPKLLANDVPLQRLSNLLDHSFDTEYWTPVYLYWGVQGVDLTDADPNDPMDYGKPVWDDAFDLADEDVQRAILGACRQVQKSRGKLHLTEETGPQRCFMEDFAEHVVAQNGTFPVPREQLVGNLTSWLRTEGRHHRRNVFMDGTGRVPLVVARYYVNSNKLTSRTEDIDLLLSAWDALVLGGAEAGAEIGGGSPGAVRHASPLWRRVAIQDSLVHSSKWGPAITGTAAFLATWLSTRNFLVSVFATLTVLCAVVYLLGMLVLAGWEFGIIESICVTILIGSSIDYCLHMAIAFSHQPGTGLPKVGAAVLEMAYTILGAAVTTALASVLLLSCKIILFRQIGTVLTLNAAIGFLVAIFLFSSLACLLR